MESESENSNRQPTYTTPTKRSLLISPPGTPPPETPISVPFKWEEAPGKPRHCHRESEPDKSSTVKTLDLPPRMLFLLETKNLDGPSSPTTVFDGPYVGRAVSFTTSYRTPRDHWNSNFGSSRWINSGYKKINTHEGSFDFSNHCTTVPKPKPSVKITRRGTFSTLSKPRSHLWASIYESFKQVVPWRRKQQTQKNCASKFDTV
ncbi:hypothetical protein Fmac_007544 [Flemingia macrophylla]|uniref:Uncharacterized protein n=1 Tax=Flemingia macrophylla TaxID=520843 RepID=A0ABD1MUU8_9FABA